MPRLKYVSGFKPLSQLLNSNDNELLLGNARFIADNNAMPNLEGTDLTEKTRLVALQVLKHAKDVGHEINRNILLLTDNGHFVILGINFFRRQGEGTCIICGSSLVTTSLSAGYKEVLRADTPEIRNLIANKSISPYGVLNQLYLLFSNTIIDREKHLASLREACDMLQQWLKRIGIQ